MTRHPMAEESTTESDSLFFPSSALRSQTEKYFTRDILGQCFIMTKKQPPQCNSQWLRVSVMDGKDESSHVIGQHMTLRGY